MADRDGIRSVHEALTGDAHPSSIEFNRAKLTMELRFANAVDLLAFYDRLVAEDLARQKPAGSSARHPVEAAADALSTIYSRHNEEGSPATSTGDAYQLVALLERAGWPIAKSPT